MKSRGVALAHPVSAALSLSCHALEKLPSVLVLRNLGPRGKSKPEPAPPSLRGASASGHGHAQQYRVHTGGHKSGVWEMIKVELGVRAVLPHWLRFPS